MKTGDILKIKSQADIEDMLEDNYHDYLFFSGDMYQYCNNEVTIREQAAREDATSKKVWFVSNNTWLWHEDWFYPPIKFLLDEDFDI